MYTIHQLFVLFCFLFVLTSSTEVSSCILNTPCRCHLTANSFTLRNCSHSLPDLPIFNTNSSINITKIIAQYALIRWPLHLCKYSSIEILDLSGSYFQSQFIDLSCLLELTHLNLSNTQIDKIPNFRNYFLRQLQFIDLSNNYIELIDGSLFHLLDSLIELNLENNPIKNIYYLEHLLSLSDIQYINLMSSNAIIALEKPLTANQWIYLAHKWNASDKSLALRTNTFSLQLILPDPEHFQLIPLDLLQIILRTLSNSTFLTFFSAPKCNCTYLRNYQRIFTFNNYDDNVPSLFQSTTCLLPNGIIHASLFDQRTFTDLNCSLITGKSIGAPLIDSACSLLNFYHFIQISLLYFICFYIIENRN